MGECDHTIMFHFDDELDKLIFMLQCPLVHFVQQQFAQFVPENPELRLCVHAAAVVARTFDKKKPTQAKGENAAANSQVTECAQNWCVPFIQLDYYAHKSVGTVCVCVCANE